MDECHAGLTAAAQGLIRTAPRVSRLDDHPVNEDLASGGVVLVARNHDFEDVVAARRNEMFVHERFSDQSTAADV
jgi:hypothetical protein